MTDITPPVLQTPEARLAEAGDIAAAPAATVPLIYIVDDEIIVGEVIEGILNLDGYRTEVFHNPHRALEQFAAANPRPRLLITDYSMEPLNGLQLIEQCARINPGLRTILISGYLIEEVIQDCPARPHQFLGKPFLPKALTEAVRRLLDG